MPRPAGDGVTLGGGRGWGRAAGPLHGAVGEGHAHFCAAGVQRGAEEVPVVEGVGSDQVQLLVVDAQLRGDGEDLKIPPSDRLVPEDLAHDRPFVISRCLAANRLFANDSSIPISQGYLPEYQLSSHSN